MTIQEILYTHQLFWRQGETVWRCECGKWEDDTCAQEENHRAHVAEVLDKHMQEREAAVIESLADELGDYRNSHDLAECAAPVEGETGRQGCIDRWIEITEDPEAWLREKSAEHHKNGFEYIRGIAFEAWQAGEDAGWENGRNSYEKEQGFIEDFDLIENPYADEEPRDGR